MYIHCKRGFFEIDQWDGTLIPDAVHQNIINTLVSRATQRGHEKPTQAVVVIRSRRRDSLHAIIKGMKHLFVTASPREWDYAWRVYALKEDLVLIMGRLAGDIDYRNFKMTSHQRFPQEEKLAHAIWHAANREDRPAIEPELPAT